MSEDAKIGCGIAVAVALLIGGCGHSAAYLASSRTVTFAVKDKQIKRYGDHDTFLAFTDQGPFKVRDSLLFFHWRSADVFGSLEVGKRYRARVAGWRVPFLSWMPDVLSAGPESLPAD